MTIGRKLAMVIVLAGLVGFGWIVSDAQAAKGQGGNGAGKVARNGGVKGAARNGGAKGAGRNGGGRQNKQDGGPLDQLAAALKTLDLTGDQQAKIDPIMSDAKDKVTALDKTDKAAYRDKVKEITKDTQKQIVPILTADQATKLKNYKQDQKNKAFADRIGATTQPSTQPATQPAPQP